MEKKEEYRYDTGLESLCKAVTSNTERKTRSRFLSMVQEDNGGECDHDSFGVENLLEELRASDSCNSQHISQFKHIMITSRMEPEPWHAIDKPYNPNGQLATARRKHSKKFRRMNKMNPSNQMNVESHLKCNNCVEVVLEDLEDLDDSQEVEQISSVPEEIPRGEYRFLRRSMLSHNAYGDSLDPCTSATADIREEQQKRQLEKETGNNKRRVKSVLIMPRPTNEHNWRARRNVRAQSANALPGAISSSSSRRSADSGVSLWSRLAGTLHRSKATPRPKQADSDHQEKTLKETDFHSPPVSTRVMAFVPPIDMSDSETNLENMSQNSRRMSKRKLAPPQPATVITHLSRKPSSENTCKGECTWAYTKKVRDEMESTCNEKCTDDMRPSNEHSDTWWAQPRDLQVDSQLLHARRAEILRPPETCVQVQGLEQISKRERHPSIKMQHEKQCHDLVEDYIAPSSIASELDIDLSDSDDNNKCACFRTFTESVAQLFFTKPIRKHGGHKKH